MTDTSYFRLQLIVFAQGSFIPALTTCLAAYLAKTLPADRLNSARVFFLPC